MAAVLMVALGLLTQAEQSVALGAFVPLGQKMDERRFNPMTLTLPDGRVLIAGGVSSEPKWSPRYSTAVDIFDPESGTLSSPGSLQVARAGTTPILLRDGRVLFVGGVWLDEWSSEIFDPDTGISETFRLQPELSGVAIAALPDGQALVGSLSGGPKSVSVLDPETGNLTPVDDPPISLNLFRGRPRPLTLPDGRILIFGARNGRFAEIDQVLIFNPVDNSFTLGAEPRFPRIQPSFALLADGRVLISGGARVTPDGRDFRYLKHAEIYDPISGSSSLTGPPVFGRRDADAVTLSDGRVLITGGEGPVNLGSKRFIRGVRAAEIYDPVTGLFTLTGDLYRLRTEAGLVALPNGRAFVAGGFDFFDWEVFAGSASVEVFKPEGEVARVQRINVAPRARSVRIGKPFAFKVRMRNSGKGVAREIRVCITFYDRLFYPLPCVTLKAIPPGQSRQAVVKGVISRRAASHTDQVVRGKTTRFEIRAIGQDVNVYATGRVRIR